MRVAGVAQKERCSLVDQRPQIIMYFSILVIHDACNSIDQMAMQHIATFSHWRIRRSAPPLSHQRDTPPKEIAVHH